MPYAPFSPPAEAGYADYAIPLTFAIRHPFPLAAIPRSDSADLTHTLDGFNGEKLGIRRKNVGRPLSAAHDAHPCLETRTV